jgi:hypothetical protein
LTLLKIVPDPIARERADLHRRLGIQGGPQYTGLFVGLRVDPVYLIGDGIGFATGVYVFGAQLWPSLRADGNIRRQAVFTEIQALPIRLRRQRSCGGRCASRAVNNHFKLQLDLVEAIRGKSSSGQLTGATDSALAPLRPRVIQGCGAS